MAIDFVMSQNFQPVQFVRGGHRHDQSIPFILAMWCCYVAQMVGSPQPDAKSCRNVLHYLLLRKSDVAKSWRKRQQLYSSGTIFKRLGYPLEQWLYGEDEPIGVDEEKARNQRVLERTKHLRKVRLLKGDDKNLYNLIGNLILRFMREKHTPFPNATRSQKLFKEVPAWKRALIYIRGLRSVLKRHANHHWNKYGSCLFLKPTFTF